MRVSVNKHKIEDYSRVGVLSFLREVSYIDSFGAVVIFLSDGMLKINQIVCIKATTTKERERERNYQLKEELHNRFNLISEERVKNFKHNSENLMKIGRKIRKL